VAVFGKKIGNLPFIGFAIFTFWMTLVFWLTDLDIETASRFYHPENELDVWSEGHEPLWRFFYYTGPIISLVVLLGSLLFLITASVVKKYKKYRIYAVFVLSTFILAPALLVNAVFKDHWGRPRPDALVNFGGHEHYVPPLKYNASGEGKSFPSGHSSVGFSLLAFWFIWRRKSQRVNHLLFISIMTFGVLMGLSRMASGAHFLSDVFWSAVIPIAVMWGLYYHVFNIPRVEHHRKQGIDHYKTPRWQTMIQIVLGLSVFTYSLFHIPVDMEKKQTFKSIETIALSAEKLELSLKFEETESVLMKYRSRGFGLPLNKLSLDVSVQDQELSIREYHAGVYSELKNRMEIVVPPNFDGALQIHLQKGDIHLVNMPKWIADKALIRTDSGNIHRSD
jgi:membrane-associated PAP2 superfamily phosphatase